MAVRFTPDAKIRFTPDEDTAAPSDESTMSDEAQAEIGAGDVARSVAAGTVGQIYGGLAMGGRALANIATGQVGAPGTDPLEAYRAASASVPGQQPITEAGKGAAAALNSPMEAGERAIEHGEDVLDPSGNLKATASDIAERGNAVAGLVGAVPAATAPVRGFQALRAAQGERAAVRAASAAAAAAEQAPLDAARAHLKAQGVPIDGVPVEGAPGRTTPATSQQLTQGYNRAVLQHVGETSSNPLEALPAARDRITGVMDDIGSRTNPQFDTELAGDMQRIQRSLPGRMSDDAAAPIHRNIEILMDAAAQNDGRIPGPVLQEVNTNLRSLEANPTLAETAGDMHDALGDLVSRHAEPGDVEALSNARQQYRNLKQIEGAVNTTTGDIDPKKLMTQLSAKKNRNQSLYGAGDQALMTTARAGARVLPDMHAQIANNAAGTLSTADRVRVKLANIAEGTALGAMGIGGGIPGVIAGGVAEGSGLAGRLRAGVVRLTGGSREAAAVARGEGTTPLGARIGGGKMRGAIGDLSQRDAIEHDTFTSPGGTGIIHTYSVPNEGGQLKVMETPGLGVRKVFKAEVDPANRGQGWGTRMLQRAVDDAHGAGQRFLSDDNVSRGQVGSYSNLARLGYRISEKGNTKHEGSWQAWGDHVFEVSPRGAPVAAGGRPLGARVGGGNQRGAVGDLTPPRRTAGSFGGRGSEEQIHETMGTEPPAAGTAAHPPLQGGAQAGSTGIPLGQMGYFRRQAGFARLTRAEPEQPRPSTLNIGLHVGKTNTAVSPNSVLEALGQHGVKVGDYSIHESATEPTLVVNTDKPLTAKQGRSIANATGQEAIAERYADGTGKLHGPKAKEWGPYDPKQFLMHDGKSADAHEMWHHGTSAEFSQFSRSAPVNDDGYMGTGHYFEKDPARAESYAHMASDQTGGNPRVVSARVVPKNPYRLAEGDRGTYGMSRDEAEKWTQNLRDKGHDAVINSAGTEMSVLDPKLIKQTGSRALGQDTSFNPAELEAAKPQQTVKNPVSNHYPGIYDDPKEIAARVQVSPEDPMMKRLFNKTRKQLHDDAIARPDVAPDSIPGVNTGPRARGSAAGKNVTTPENAERIVNTINAFKDAHPDAYHGMVGWYEMQALHDKVASIIKNPKMASKAYERLNTMMGMASPGSDVVTEINRGTAAHMMAQQGKFEQFQRYGGNPGSRGAVKNAPELANVSGHPYHSTSQAVPMRRYLDTGVGAQAPKTSMYIRASDAPNRVGSTYQNKVLVGDSHYSRGIGLSDVRTSADPHGSISGSELADIHPWYHESVAKPLGMRSTSAQAVQWGALAHETGVETAVGAPKLELFSQEVAKAAKRAGVEPEVMLERIIKGAAHAG